MCISVLVKLKSRLQNDGRVPAATLVCLWILGALLVLGGLWVSAQGQPPSGQDDQAPPKSGSAVKADTKKAKAAFQEGMKAQKNQDWAAALSAYSDAVALDPNNRQYQLHRESALSQVVQAKVDTAERDAVAGHFEDAERELIGASKLDPSNAIVKERLMQLILASEPEENRVQARDISGEIHLDYRPGQQKFDYRGDTHGAYEQLAQRFGVEVQFDPDLRERNIRFQIGDEVDFPTAARLLGDMTKTFWRPLTRHLFFVAEDTPEKRKELDASVVRTLLLPASETPDQMTEVLRTVREMTGITRSDLDVRSRTLTLRASPQAVSVATNLINSLEQPRGELVLEMEILEVDRNYAMQLGITPPQTAKAFTISTAQIQEAEQSESGLIDVIDQILGSTSSGLIPPVVAFGGGLSTYFAELPGVSANFAQMLSLVRAGRRALLRAQDGEPATFFVGTKIPVSLSSYSASIDAAGATGVGSTITNPIANYATGNEPVAIVEANFHNALDTSNIDLAVANQKDDTVSILQGNGDGTFNNQTVQALPAGFIPTNMATTTFTNSGHQDLVLTGNVSGSTTGEVVILLGNGDGTFTESSQSPIKVGANPVFVVTSDFNSDGFQDIAIANQGSNSIQLFLGNGDGTFRTPPPPTILLPVGSEPASLAAADLNGDGRIDLVSANQGSNNISVFFGNGNGTFQNPTNYATGNSPVYVALGDFNNQGALDIAVADNGAASSSNTGDSVTIYYNQISTEDVPLGTFVAGATRDFAVGNGPTSLAIADYNLDGFADIAVTDETDNAVTILFNTGTESFTASPEIPVGTAPVSIATADFNGDGRPDAAVADNGAAEATVILNTASLLGAGGIGSSIGAPFPGVQYLDVGLKIKATPRVHLNGDVTLQLSFELSSVAGQSLNSIPVIDTENVDQTVRIKQNETAVLAGFFQSQLTNALNGNPGIGEIPGAGLLDSDQNNQRQDEELLILVTPRMVRLAPRENQAIYAGQGALEGEGGPAGPANAPPIAPPPQQPGGPQPQPQPNPLVQPPQGQQQPPPDLQAPPQPPSEQPQQPPPDQSQEPGGRPQR